MLDLVFGLRLVNIGGVQSTLCPVLKCTELVHDYIFNTAGVNHFSAVITRNVRIIVMLHPAPSRSVLSEASAPHPLS